MSVDGGRNRYLVVVRSGEGSLHRSWLSDESDRHWDLIESYYGADPRADLDERFERIVDRGVKWNSLKRLFESRPELLIDYDYVWLPDDDLACTQEDINRIFELTRKYDLLVAQPSLSGDSYHSHATLLENSEFLLRYTNYIEVMCPCFNARYLQSVVPLLDLSPSGWGLDNVWCMLTANPRERSAILDCVQVTHTRALGTGSIYENLAKMGSVPIEDREALLERFTVRPDDPTIYSGIRTDGTYCAFRPKIAWLTFLGMRAHLARTPDRRRLRRAAKRIFREHLINRREPLLLSYKPGREIEGLELPLPEFHSADSNVD